MTENQATTKLLSKLKPHGFFWKAADRFTSGIPDIIGCYLGRFVSIEMKVDRGTPTALQKYNMKEISRNTGYVAVITYSNSTGMWEMGNMECSLNPLVTRLLDRMRHHDED